MYNMMTNINSKAIKNNYNIISWVKDNFIIIIYGLTLMCMAIFMRTGNSALNYVRYIYCVFILCVVLFGQKKLIINKVALIILALFLIHSVLFGFILLPGDVLLKSSIFDNGKELLMFWVFVFCTAQYVYTRKKFNEFIIVTYAVISLFINIIYLTNFNGWAPIKFLPNLFGFGDESRVRFTFGYGATNTAAYSCLPSFILSVLVWRMCVKNKKILTKSWSIPKIYTAVSLIVSLLMLLSTQTRVALIIALSFWILPKIIASLNGYKYKKITMFFILIAILSVIILYFYFVFNFGDSRSEYFLHNLEIFHRYGNHLTGMGYASFFAFLNNLYGYGTGPMDDFYLYILCSTGYLGLIIMMIAIIITMIYLIIIVLKKSSILNIHAIILYFILLFLGVTEAALFYSFGFANAIYWMLIFITIMSFDKKYYR